MRPYWRSERSRPQLVLALALIHHLVISRNVPMQEFVDFLADAGADLVVEFPTPEDPMVRGLLRNKAAVSSLRDFTERKFRSVLEEPTYEEGDGDRSKVKRILLTSGKLYYELAARKGKDKRDDIAIVRIEQLAPLPKRRLNETLDRYPNAEQFFWVQEEPENQGPWPTFGLVLPELLPDKLAGIKRISRRAMSAPSTAPTSSLP